MKLSEAQIGRQVIYTPYGNFLNKKTEEGIISSFNDKYIFVKFNLNALNGIPCEPDDLEYPT